MPWLTYRELAVRLGVSRDAAKMVALRRGWQRQAANKPGGTVRVLVSDDVDGVEQGGVPPRAEYVPEQVPPIVPTDVPAVPGAVLAPVPGGAPAVPMIPASLLADQQARHDGELERERDRADRRLADALDRQRADHQAALADRDRLHVAELARLRAFHDHAIGTVRSDLAAVHRLAWLVALTALLVIGVVGRWIAFG